MLMAGAIIGVVGILLTIVNWDRTGAALAAAGCLLIGYGTGSDWVRVFAWVWAFAILGVLALDEVQYRREYKRDKEEEEANGSEEFHA